jgi:uncharacterized lipoprotein NlpE involved in copper resistance
MKNILLLALFAFAGLISCKPKDAAVSDPTAQTADTTMTDNTQNAGNTLSWNGMYKGVLPCADCQGIETVLVLNADNTYLLRTNYLGMPDAQAVEKTGSMTWNAEGNTVTLGGIENAPNQYFVGENKVIQLDLAGKMITGQLADKYILTKQ